MTRRHLDVTPLIRGGMLDERDQPVGHEAPGADDLAGPGDLANLDDPACRDHLQATSSAGRDELERLDTLARVNERFDPIALHGDTLDPAPDAGTTRPAGAETQARAQPADAYSGWLSIWAFWSLPLKST